MWDLIVSVPDHCLSFYFETKFNFLTLSIGISVPLTNYSHWDSCLRWFMGLKNAQMFVQTKTFQGWRS